MNEYKYWFLEGAYDSSDNCLYYFGGNINGFFRMNVQEKKVHLLNSLENIEYSNEMYAQGVVIDGKAYFPPRNALKLAIYDIESDELNFFDLYTESQIKEWGIAPSLNGYHILQKKEYIFFIFRDRAVCVKWNIIDGSTSYITYNDAEFMILAKDFESSGNIYYFPLISANGMLEFDIDKEEFKKHTFTNENQAYSSILRLNNKMLFIPMKGTQILVWDTVNNCEVSIKIEDLNTDYGYCYHAVTNNDNVLLIPIMDNLGDKNEVIILDGNLNIIDKKNIFDKYEGYRKWRMLKYGKYICYFMYKSANKYLARDTKYVCLDIDSMELKEFNLPIWCESERVSQEILLSQKKYIYIGYITENADFSVGEYIQLIDIKKNEDKEIQKTGEKIHNRVLEI